MKRQIQESGERKWYGNDHIIMQNELWTAIESFFEPYGCAILKGCQINIDTDKWTVGAGVVGLYAPDKSEYRVCKFQETQLPISTPVVYLSLQSREETEEYLTGGVKPILKEYYAEVSATAPSSGEYLVIKKDGNNTNFRKAFQDATARMVTDAQIQNWTSKEPAINKKSGFNLDKSDSTSSSSSGVLATSKAVSSAKSEAMIGVQGGASSSVNTLKKLYDWAVGQLNGKEPKITKKSGFNLDKSDSASSSNSGVLATSKAVSAAKGEAMTSVQGGASSSVNTLKKLYDWTVGQLGGKEPKIAKKSGFNLDKSDSASSSNSSVLATSKAVSAAKGEAMTSVQGGASSSVNTLKKLYDWAVGQLNGKVSKSGDVMTDSLLVKRPGQTNGAMIYPSTDDNNSCIVGMASSQNATPTNFLRVGSQKLTWTKGVVEKPIYNAHQHPMSDSISSSSSTSIASSKAVKNVCDLISGVLIPSGYNLNNISTPGNYYCPMNSTAATLANCPTSYAFSLEVKRDAGFIQILRCYSAHSDLQWYRNYYNGTWTGWIRLVTRMSDSITSTSNASGGYAASPKAVNDARLNAVTSVQGGVSSGVDTLKKLYDWAVGQLNGKVSKAGDVMTGALINTHLNGTTGAWVSGSSVADDGLFGVSDKTKKVPSSYIRIGASGLKYNKDGKEGVIYNGNTNPISDSISSSSSTSIASSKAVKAAYDLAMRVAYDLEAKKEDKQAVQLVRGLIVYRESDLGCLFIIDSVVSQLQFSSDSKIEDLASGTKILEVLNTTGAIIPVILSSDYLISGITRISPYSKVTVTKVDYFNRIIIHN